MTSIELPTGLTSIAPARADRRRVGVQRVVRRAAGLRLRVTALNSTPVIFYVLPDRLRHVCLECLPQFTWWVYSGRVVSAVLSSALETNWKRTRSARGLTLSPRPLETQESGTKLQPTHEPCGTLLRPKPNRMPYFTYLTQKAKRGKPLKRKGEEVGRRRQ